MSIGLYDKAIGDKIKSWVLDPKMRIIYPDETNRFFSYMADENEDQLTLPLISISRDRNTRLILKNRRYAQLTGKTFNHTKDSADHLNFIPIELRYQIDIYTRYRQEADEYLRNFVFNIINYPTLLVELPYKECGLKQKSFMELEEDLQDNSDIPERLVPGLFTRVTLRLKLQDAGLYSYTIDEIPKITHVDINTTPDMQSAISIKEGQPSHNIEDDCEPASEFNIEN